MSTLNHDAELEEILDELQAQVEDGYAQPVNGWTTLKQEAKAAIHAYFYKQTLELIGLMELMKLNEPGFNNDVVARNGLRTQLRKAAAERWGQE